jgi:hypothetical protein
MVVSGIYADPDGITDFFTALVHDFRCAESLPSEQISSSANLEIKCGFMV